MSDRPRPQKWKCSHCRQEFMADSESLDAMVHAMYGECLEDNVHASLVRDRRVLIHLVPVFVDRYGETTHTEKVQ